MIYVDVSDLMMFKALKNVKTVQMPTIARKWKAKSNLALLTGIKQIKKD